ncbi:hypothetical protein TIFTF001_033662 [Ficus carica]|uniref:Uncharacterized protein n=1 Tax=Ficus carica TaxID=3494 RepID=A0AA88DZ39_FICCA|nr:hypothetical protein TIFTF001_033662 [Ficus carica]
MRLWKKERGERELCSFSLSGQLLFALWFSQSPKQSRAGPYSNLRKKGRDSGDDDENGDGMQETAARSDLLPFHLDLSALPRRPIPFSDEPLRLQIPCRFADLPSQIYSCDDQEHRRFAPSKATRSLLVDSGPNPARFRGDGGCSSMGGGAIVDREGNP